MKKILTIAVLVLAYLSNPTEEQFKTGLKEKVNNLQSFEESGFFGNLDDLKQAGAIIGDAIGLKTLDKYVENNQKVDNYYLFSIQSLKLKDTYKPVSIGAFTKIFYFSDLGI